MLGVALAGCGGESRDDKPPAVTAPADAVLAIWSADGSTELRIVREGQTGAALFGRTDGTYLLSPDRQRLFLANQDGSTVIRSVDGTERVLADTYFLADMYSVAWSPDGTRITLVENARVVIADGDGDNPVPVPTDASGGSSSVAWAPDGSRVAFGVDSNLVQAPAEGSSAVTVSTGPPTPAGSDFLPALDLRWAPDGSSIAVAPFDQQLMFIDATGAMNVSDAKSGATYGWSVDASGFAIETRDLTCAVVSPAGTSEDVLGGCDSAVWSPVEARLALNQYGRVLDGNVVVWSAGDDAPSTLVEHPARSALSWSPDGTVIAYETGDVPDGFVFVDSSDGTEFARIVAPEFHWNRAGTRLYYLTADAALVTADGRGGAQQTILSDARAVTWLPDSEYLAVATSTQVFTLRADGTHRTPVWSPPSSNQGFEWVKPQSPR